MTGGEAALAVLSVGLLLVALWGTRWLAPRLGLDAEASRKLVHVAVGLYALLFPLLFASAAAVALVALLSVALLLVVRSRRQASDGLGSALHGVARRSYGEILFGIAVAILFSRSAGAPVLFVLPVAVLTLADAAAALAGSAYGRRRLAREEGQKSVEGAVVFFLVAAIVSLVALLLLTDAPRGLVAALGLATALFGTLIETDSWLGFDNLFVPVALHLVLQRLLPTDAATVVLVTLVAVAVWVVARRVGPRFGLSTQAASAYAITALVLLATTDWWNALPPILAFPALALAERRRPSHDQWFHLRALAAIVVSALVFLIIGESFGRSALHHFALGALALGAAGLALARAPLLPTLAAAVPLVGAFLIAIVHNRAEGLAPSVLYLALAPKALALALVPPLFAPALFARLRAAKLALLSTGPSLLLYLADARA